MIMRLFQMKLTMWNVLMVFHPSQALMKSNMLKLVGPDI
uniref:Uncharacterized protein n=1 Tax=Octopus bimaculoides TaxID=37653 RepID=A0A0L8IA70_OCTBM